MTAQTADRSGQAKSGEGSPQTVLEGSDEGWSKGWPSRYYSETRRPLSQFMHRPRHRTHRALKVRELATDAGKGGQPVTTSVLGQFHRRDRSLTEKERAYILLSQKGECFDETG